MSVIKKYEGGQWVTIVVGKQGPTGETGPQGPQGEAGSGGQITDSGSYASPNLITTAIDAPASFKQRTFIQGSSGAVVDPTLGNGSASYELFLFGCSDTNTVELNSTTNLLLNGPIVLKLGSLLYLQWITGLAKWVEVSRNEI